jgi:hypothetical protein
MKIFFNIVLSIICASFLLACNKNLTGEEKEELYSKSQTREDIIKRSGTLMRAGTDERLLSEQMKDAENRLISGGGLFGKGGLELINTDKKDGGGATTIGMPINPYLWRGSIETIDFMPLLSADPFAGIIITDWYTDQNNKNQRCKLNIFVKGIEMITTNLKVNSFCQTLSKENNWIDEKVDIENNRQLENAILNKAKKIKLSQG